MATLAQFGRYQMPVPADFAGAVDEDEYSHPASFCCSDPDRDPPPARPARARFEGRGSGS
jgi:hypothetical protein